MIAAGGGVWSIQADGEAENVFHCACMYKGACVVRVNSADIEVLNELTVESDTCDALVYGCVRVRNYILLTSFYNSTAHAMKI